MFRRIGSLLLVSLLGACAGQGTHVSGLVAAEPVELPSGWRARITAEDAPRLDALPAALSRLGNALPARQRSLVESTAALDYPAPPPGAYRCRVATARKADFCHVSAAAEGLAFAKQTGTGATAGYLYPDGKRFVFLGARQRRAGETSLGYGADAGQDVVGTLERIGNFRWRLVVASAATAQPTLYELTPVPSEQQPSGRIAR